MSLATGDLTTQQRVATWLGNAPTLPSPVLAQLITSMTAMIYGKLNRARLYSQTFTRTFDGVGNAQIMLPDWPVTAIASVQQGQSLVPFSVLPPPGGVQPANTNACYGIRWVAWNGSLPGDPTMLEFDGGWFYSAPQNIKVTYTAGYAISGEAGKVPSGSPYTVTVQQPQGVWCRDIGVTYAATGIALTPVTIITGAGQYIVPSDANPGTYTFGSNDANADLLFSYSFIPADLEEACIQMVAERYSYRSRIGEIMKSLGGQETIRYQRGMLPPEVMALIQPYVSVIYPAIGAPL